MSRNRTKLFSIPLSSLICLLPLLSIGICSPLFSQTEEEFEANLADQAIAKEVSLLDQISAFKGDYIIRPARHAGRFETLVVDFKMDGIEGQHMALKGPVISLKGSVPTDWQEDPTMMSRYSIAFRNRYSPEVFMTFTVIHKNNFLSSYDEQEVIAYLAGLRSIHRDRLKLNDMPPLFREDGFNAHLLAKDTLHLDYSISDRSNKGPAIRYILYLVLVDSHWVEISLMGPEDKLEGFIPPFQRFLRNLSLVQNEAEAFGYTK